MLTKLPVIAALTAQDIVVASEPTWLQQWRQAAWQHVNEGATPLWRRTDLTAFALTDMEYDEYIPAWECHPGWRGSDAT